MREQLRGKLLLNTVMNNKNLLLVTADEWGILKYQLTGHSGICLALSNISETKNLPYDTEPFDDKDALLAAVTRTLAPSTQVAEVVYWKAMTKEGRVKQTKEV